MLATHISKLMTLGKSLILAYDHGLEHGPTEFNLENIDPAHIVAIAEHGRYNAVVLHHGLAEKYYSENRNRVPLIIKLNGKTNLPRIEPVSPQICSIRRAVALGAIAVGYTIYLGSANEPAIFREFGAIVEEAHNYSIPVIAWIYPRGENVKDELSTQTLAYAARVGLELGADFIKIKYNGDKEAFRWVVKAAGKTRVLVAGGEKLSERQFLQQTADIIEAGAVGLAVGRNVWQHHHPIEMTQAIKHVLFEGKPVDEALHCIN